jgi:hypothetical protein
MNALATILTSTVIILVLLAALDFYIPRAQPKPLENKPLFWDQKVREQFVDETYGPDWDKMTLDEFLDMWQSLSAADKFYYSTACWKLAA